MTEFWYFLGDVFYKTFEILPFLGNWANLAFLIISFVLFFYWVAEMIKHEKAGEL